MAFDAFDSNRDGYITKAEMMALSKGRLTKDQIDKAFESLDINGDGALSREEFYKMMNRSKNKSKKK